MIARRARDHIVNICKIIQDFIKKRANMCFALESPNREILGKFDFILAENVDIGRI